MKNLMSEIRRIARDPTRFMALNSRLLRWGEGQPARGSFTVVRSFPVTKKTAEKHVHDTAEIFLQLVGHNRIITPSEQLLQKEGTLLFMPPRTPHEEHAVPRRDFWAHWVCEIRPHNCVCHLTMGKPGADAHGIVAGTVLTLENPLLVWELGREIARHKPGVAPSACLRAIFALLRDALQPAAAEEMTLGQKARLLINRSLADPQLSVTRLASELGCHPDHLSREFTRQEGQTLRSYLREQRLLLAQEFLRQRGIPISQAAKLSGYTDHSHFTADFRRRHGKTPRESRENSAS